VGRLLTARLVFGGFGKKRARERQNGQARPFRTISWPYRGVKGSL